MAVAVILLLLVPAAQAEEIPDSGDIDPGETYAYTFQELEEGLYYHCHPHPQMWAMVHVLENRTEGTTTHHVEIYEVADFDEWGYAPQHLSIEVGDTVVWHNNGTLRHTVSPGNPNGDDGHPHDHGDAHPHDESTDTPALPPLLLGAALVGLVALRRRP